MPHTLGTLNWCLILRGKTIPGLIAAMLPLANVASADTCLPANVTLSNWQEGPSVETGKTGESVRCLQSKTNTALELCFTRKVEPAECRISVRFQGKSLDFSADSDFPVGLEEKVTDETDYKFGCDVTTSRISTSIAISPLESVGVYEETDVPKKRNCMNGMGEFLDLQESQSYFIASYLVQVGYDKKWETDTYQPEEVEQECLTAAPCPVTPAAP
jgi:hypothetical protein